MKPYQIINLYETERGGFYEAIQLERVALTGGKLINIKGLIEIAYIAGRNDEKENNRRPPYLSIDTCWQEFKTENNL